MKIFNLFLFITIVGFSAFGQVENCEATWRRLNEIQLINNLDGFITDVKKQLIASFAESQLTITGDDIDFNPTVKFTRFQRYDRTTGYFFNPISVPNVVVKSGNRTYQFKLIPFSKVGQIKSDFSMIGTYVRESQRYNSIGDISQLTCRAATGLFGMSSMNEDYSAISQYSIIRVETNYGVGATSELNPPTNGYTDELIEDVLLQ